MTVPLPRDAGAVTERAFVTRTYAHRHALDRLQMHVIGNDGLHRIAVACFEMEGHRSRGAGRVAARRGRDRPTPPSYHPPRGPNTRVGMSPYGRGEIVPKLLQR